LKSIFYFQLIIITSGCKIISITWKWSYFFAGLINDVVLGFPLGLSSLTYLIVSLVATYVKNMTVHTTIASDWFTFLIALLFSNLIFYLLTINFSNISINVTDMSYNTFFTFIFFPFFWLFFNYYHSLVSVGSNA